MSGARRPLANSGGLRQLIVPWYRTARYPPRSATVSPRRWVDGRKFRHLSDGMPRAGTTPPTRATRLPRVASLSNPSSSTARGVPFGSSFRVLSPGRRPAGGLFGRSVARCRLASCGCRPASGRRRGTRASSVTARRGRPRGPARTTNGRSRVRGNRRRARRHSPARPVRVRTGTSATAR